MSPKDSLTPFYVRLRSDTSWRDCYCQSSEDIGFFLERLKNQKQNTLRQNVQAITPSVRYLSDIPLLPATTTKDGSEPNFVVHWLNNKELHFSLEADRIMAELHNQQLAGGEETETNDSDTGNNDTDDGPDTGNFEAPEGKGDTGSETGDRGYYPLL